MKILWFLIPIISIWILCFIGYTVLPASPFDTWWALPLAINLVGAWVGTLTLAFIKTTG